MLALQSWRDEALCPLSQGPKDVCQAPYGTYLYSTEVPARCMVSDAISTARKGHENSANPQALLFRPRITPWGTPS
jgi:hypothetical protein